jgi:hypothetical protein
MNGRSAQLVKLQRRSDENLAEFLRTEVAAGFAIAELAETEYQIGNHAVGARSVQHVAQAYSTLRRFLDDTRQTGRLTSEVRQELTAGAERLKSTLDDLAANYNRKASG